MKLAGHTKLQVVRDDSRNSTVLTIVLDDLDLNRHHLVQPNIDAPVDDLARYALHCLQTMYSQTVDEKYRLLSADRKNGYPENYKPGRFG